MTHPIHRVERVAIVAPCTLALSFEDVTEQQIDFRPVLEGELLPQLQDPTVFNAVTLDKGVGTVTWPNRACLDPSTLHDWPRSRTNLWEWRVVVRRRHPAPGAALDRHPGLEGSAIPGWELESLRR